MSYPLSPFGPGSWGGQMLPPMLPMQQMPQPSVRVDYNMYGLDRQGNWKLRKPLTPGAVPSQLTIDNPASVASGNAQRSGQTALTPAEQQAAMQAWEAWQQMQAVMTQNPGCMSKCVIS